MIDRVLLSDHPLLTAEIETSRGIRDKVREVVHEISNAQCTLHIHPPYELISCSYIHIPVIAHNYYYGTVEWISDSPYSEKTLQILADGCAHYFVFLESNRYMQWCRRVQEPFTFPPLTCREREILMAMFEGYSSQQIINRLHISLRTLSTHRYHLYSKLRAHHPIELINNAREAGFFSYFI